MNRFRRGEECKDLWSGAGLDLSPGCAFIVLGLSFLISKMRQVILYLRIVVEIRYVQNAGTIYWLDLPAASNSSISCICSYFFFAPIESLSSVR